MILWVGFLTCTAIIIYSGTRLSRYGDVLAEKTGMGRSWTGLILMASVTSLPELITGISSVTYADVPDIAVGDVLGSCVFNLLILSALDAFYRNVPASTKAHHGNVLSGSIGILLLGIVVVSLFMGNRIAPVGWVGPYTFLFGIVYVVAVKLIFQYEKRILSAYIKDVAGEQKYRNITTKDAFIAYAFNAFLVVLAAVFLPVVGEGIAESTGLGQTFVGNIFIAVSTSLPEVVVSITAVKMDAIDLAIGNLLGSNIFNIFILAVDDVFFIKGPLLSYASSNNILSAISAIVMTSIAVIGLTYRAEKKKLFLAWDSIGILLVYVLNLMGLYTLR